MKKLLIAGALMLVCGVASASAVQTATVPLSVSSGGTLAPKGTVKIDLSALFQQAPYKVTCTMTNPQSSNTKVVIMPTYLSGSGPIDWSPTYSVNGTAFTTLGELDKATNAFEAKGVKNLGTGSALTISNLDNSVTVSVTSCQATPVIGAKVTK